MGQIDLFLSLIHCHYFQVHCYPEWLYLLSLIRTMTTWKDIYTCIYVLHLISFLTFFVHAFKIIVDSWKFSILLLFSILLFMRWLTNFYDFRFKWTATTAIGIHPTKAWLSQLVNLKNAIWTWGLFRRAICNKILFYTWKKGHRNIWNASDCFLTIFHESSISFWVA